MSNLVVFQKNVSIFALHLQYRLRINDYLEASCIMFKEKLIYEVEPTCNLFNYDYIIAVPNTSCYTFQRLQLIEHFFS